MAWQNVPLLDGQSTVFNYDIFTVQYPQIYSYGAMTDYMNVNLTLRSNLNGTIIENGNYKITAETQWDTTITVSFWDSGSVIATLNFGSFGGTTYITWCIGIDESNQTGSIRLLYTNYDNASVVSGGTQVGNLLNTNWCYNFIKGITPPAYNWQSVPSISGKNGILSLVTLDSESINDGEPVSGAAISVFDQNPVSGNNVKDIVDGNTPLIPSAVDVTAAFIISNPPVGELASRILAAKKDSIPESIEDADKTVSIPANASNATMPDLDENSQYYFAIFVADAVGDTAVSDPKDIYTSADEGWLFDYTGQIQTFTAPKTGIYSLETWGAQGGDATDGTNTARGGYGAYAYCEVLLQQGDTLYINVGGQNGYGGGGNYTPPNNE